MISQGNNCQPLFLWELAPSARGGLVKIWKRFVRKERIEELLIAAWMLVFLETLAQTLPRSACWVLRPLEHNKISQKRIKKQHTPVSRAKDLRTRFRVESWTEDNFRSTWSGDFRTWPAELGDREALGCRWGRASLVVPDALKSNEKNWSIMRWLLWTEFITQGLTIYKRQVKHS